ncbi:MAG: RNA pyrophosphohydrolase [Novosphingobium meiothermophilum]|uniref:RNA pyrophosphohydrolase n=1 Tax=Novosphingobium TaxID=165696 RepID=UPI000D6E11FA|nr:MULTISPECIES: RNA pyrophosphohydrolase [Novosphingobium]
MTDPFAGLPYRPCVGIMLVNHARRVFVGKRIDNRESEAWQMPQGGIDDGEELHLAALRELEEETGIAPHLVTIIAETREELLYDLPDFLMGRMWGGRYRGQRQKWLLMRFNGQDADIRLDAHEHAEFEAWQWVEPDQLPELIVPFKKRVYRQVVEEFRDLI